MENNSNSAQPNVQQVVVNQIAKKSNGLGTAGFVCALLGILFCWIPVLGWILWLLGLIFSFIGVFKSPRGLAITGLVLSLLDLILLIAVVGAVAAAFSL